jgi:hypothetical protein
MADNFPTPVAAATSFATKDIGGVHYPKNLITDQTGADAIGAVTASPAANTLLGRLKAIYDEIVARLPTLGPKAASGSVSVAPTNDGFPVTTDAGSSATAAAVTPNDNTALTMRALYVGGAGDVVATIGGADITFKAVPVGSILPIKATKVKATGTTATNMVALG